MDGLRAGKTTVCGSVRRRERARCAHQSRSAPAQAAKQQPADRAGDGQEHAGRRGSRRRRRCRGSRPPRPRRRSGRSGAGSSVTTAIRTAIASKSDASRPTACSSSQLRKICAKTATSTNATTRPPWSRLRSAASPLHSSRPVARARCRRPALAVTMTASRTSGSHHGSPSGPTSVNDVSARASPRREDRELCGDQRRDLRAHLRRGPAQRADPRRHAELSVEQAAEHPHARGAVERAARDRPAGRLDAEVPCLAADDQRHDLQQSRDRENPEGGAGQRGRELVATAGERAREQAGRQQRADDGDRGPVATRVAPQPSRQLASERVTSLGR